MSKPHLEMLWLRLLEREAAAMDIPSSGDHRVSSGLSENKREARNRALQRDARAVERRLQRQFDNDTLDRAWDETAAWLRGAPGVSLEDLVRKP